MIGVSGPHPHVAVARESTQAATKKGRAARFMLNALAVLVVCDPELFHWCGGNWGLMVELLVWCGLESFVETHSFYFYRMKKTQLLQMFEQNIPRPVLSEDTHACSLTRGASDRRQ
jgi:hypothetical protein